MLRLNLCALTALLIISSAALEQEWETTATPQLILPPSYAWLGFQISVMNFGGPIPKLTDEQWVELEDIMDEENFFRLCELLLGELNTAALDMTTWGPVTDVEIWQQDLDDLNDIGEQDGLDDIDELDGILADLYDVGSGLAEVLDMVGETFDDEAEQEIYGTTAINDVKEVFAYEDEGEAVMDGDDWEYNSEPKKVYEPWKVEDSFELVPDEDVSTRANQETPDKNRLWSFTNSDDSDKLKCNSFRCNIARGDPGAVVAVVTIGIASLAIIALAAFLAYQKRHPKGGYRKFEHADTLLPDDKKSVPPV